ncbi:MAG: hypothetical protein OJF59_001460 [Cytophagales bacterium]|nr:MAG: hypothetical protein OJF59_001460 [Cytophagales bacterium]
MKFGLIGHQKKFELVRSFFVHAGTNKIVIFERFFVVYKNSRALSFLFAHEIKGPGSVNIYF